MDVHLGQELLDELGSSLESLETQQGALLQFLKDKGIVTDEQLAPYLTQAGNASSVRWRAARLRLERLLSSAQEKEQETTKQQKGQGSGTQTPPEKSAKAKSPNEVSAKADDEKVKSLEENSESVESSGAKAEEQAKPSPKGREQDAA